MIFRFLHPWFFLGLLAIPLLLWAWQLLERKGRARIVFSDLSALRTLPPTRRVKWRRLLPGLRALAIAAAVTALARPQSGNRTQEVLSKGIDIMIVLDNSTSMQSPDLQPNRLGAAKQVVQRFIAGRQKEFSADRIGLVAFSKIAFTRCPLTVDYAILQKIVGGVIFTKPEFDGTAIGAGLATAVARIKDSDAKSKVIILVTDGENNSGIDPMTAAAMAQAFQIKLYTIGVVPTGMLAPRDHPIFGKQWVPALPNVDESQMIEIAKSAGGKYFRATDNESLAKIFEEIDRMEKTEVKVKERYRYSEAFSPWLALALCAFILEAALGRTVFMKVP